MANDIELFRIREWDETAISKNNRFFIVIELIGEFCKIRYLDGRISGYSVVRVLKQTKEY